MSPKRGVKMCHCVMCAAGNFRLASWKLGLREGSDGWARAGTIFCILLVRPLYLNHDGRTTPTLPRKGIARFTGSPCRTARSCMPCSMAMGRRGCRVRPCRSRSCWSTFTGQRKSRWELLTRSSRSGAITTRLVSTAGVNRNIYSSSSIDVVSMPWCPSDQSFLFGSRPSFTRYADHIPSKVTTLNQGAKFDPKNHLSLIILNWNLIMLLYFD